MYKMFIIHNLHLLYIHFGVLQTNVIIESNNLTTEQIAQIQNIITREIQTDISNIHISIK